MICSSRHYSHSVWFCCAVWVCYVLYGDMGMDYTLEPLECTPCFKVVRGIERNGLAICSLLESRRLSGSGCAVARWSEAASWSINHRVDRSYETSKAFGAFYHVLNRVYHARMFYFKERMGRNQRYSGVGAMLNFVAQICWILHSVSTVCLANRQSMWWWAYCLSPFFVRLSCNGIFWCNVTSMLILSCGKPLLLINVSWPVLLLS